MLKITKNQGSIQVTADKSGFYPFDGTITFPTNSLFTATSANTDMITFKSTSNGDVQFVGNYKDITISGRSYDTKQKFLTAFSNLANQGSVDAYTKAETDAKIDAKQNKLKAGNGITLTEDATDNTTVVKTAVSLTDNGNGAYTVGDSIGIGDRASVRIGNNNNVLQGQNSIVIGDHAMTNSEKCIAIGNSSEVNAGSTCSIVIGDSARANGSQNIAIGDNRRCDGTKNVSIGCGKLDTVDVNGDSNVCIGENSNVHAKNNAAVNNSIAIGSGAKAGAYFCTVIGNSANSKSSHAVAIGDGAYVEHDCDSSVAVGNSARAYGKNSVAIGCTSYANDVKPLDICCGKKDNNEVLSVLQSDANGKISLLKGDGTDERMVIQDEIEALKNAGGSGGGGTVDAYTKAETDTKLDAKQDKLTAGNGITITKDETAGKTFVGTKLAMDRGPFNDDGISIGRMARVEFTNGIAFGDESLSKNGGIAIGYKAKSSGISSIVIGKDSSDQDGAAIGTSVGSGVVIGDNARGSGAGVVIGPGTHGGGVGAVIGYNSTVDGNGYGYAIGDSVHISETTKMVPIAIGYGAVANETKPLAVTILKITDTDSDGNYEMKYCDFIQGDANGKISLLKGDGTDERMVIQDEIEALKNAGGSGGTVDAYTKAETDNLLNAKQGKLKAGNGITLTEDATDGTTVVKTAVSLTDNGNGAYTVGNSIKMEREGLAIGMNASGRGSSLVAIGNNANGYGNGSVAIGNRTNVEGSENVVIGTFASSISHDGVAIGYNSRTNSRNGVAIGHNSRTDENTPLVIRAGYKTVGDSTTPLTVLQSDSTGKISVLLGDGTDTRMVISDEITALKAEITTLKAEIAALKGGASTGDTTGA